MPHRRLATGRFLATVLFTDIVGSTEHAAGLGDRAWRDLLERHHALVRRELRVFQGREIGTSGDGFLALFEAPEAAVRAAEAITSAVGSLGLAVRAGVHTGECEVAGGGGIGGMAVHIGSRVAALAGPGEVLVTGSVRDLMTGSDRAFTGGETRELKGVAEPWRVYRLVPEPTDGDLDGDRISSRRPAMLPLYSRRSRRRLLVGTAGLVVVAVALSTLGYRLTTSGADAGVEVGENAVGVIGPGDDAPRDAVPVGKRPTAVAAGFGSVWVTNSGDNSLTRIDRHTLTGGPVPTGGASPSGVTVGFGSVWVANSGDATVTRIDPTTARPTTISVRPGPTGVVAAFGSVWVTNSLDASVTEIDPDTNTIAKVVPVGAGPTGIAAGAGYLWVTNQGDGTVTRFNPDTYVADSAINVGTGPVGIAVTDDAAWVTNNLEGSLSRIDAETLTVTGARTLAAEGGAYGVAARGDDVWVSNEYAGTLMRVTASTFRLANTIELRGAPLGLAYVGKDLWFTNAAGGSDLHRGGVLTVVGSGFVYSPFGDPPALDPTVGYDQASWRLAALTHDGLVGLRRAAGVQGTALVADLATSVPKPTDGGLTYTFHLRKGVRYSTGEPVLAGDIRRGIERTIMDELGPGYAYYSAIIGGTACTRDADRAVAADKPLPDCDLREGIVANDETGTVTFHLTRPTPEFVYQLTLPSAVAVPQDTPTELEPGQSLPATGPYMVKSYLRKQDAADGHGRLELVRNPYFRAWSRAAQPDGYPDRIVLDSGYNEQESVARVTDGRADLLWDGVQSTDADMLRTRYGQQLLTNAGIYLQYLFLNATKPPFDDRTARRAVAFALDRAALARPFGGPVTCQLVPPDFPAHRPYCPFTVGRAGEGAWSGPDVVKARALVRRSGTRGAAVVVVAPGERPTWATAGRRVQQLLDRLGYRASLQLLSEEDFIGATADPRNDFNAGLALWGADFPTAASYVGAVAGCGDDVGVYNLSGSCDEALDARMAAATEQQVRDLAGANEVWAALDREVVDAAATIPFSVLPRRDFVSSRVGNTPVHILSGPLVAQMWVQ